MGLSSSQGRLLMLTSRLSDIELQQMLISQRQNQLAWKEADAAKEYSEAMNNYKLVMKVTDADGERVDKDLDFSTLTSMGYLVTNSSGAICLEKEIFTKSQLLEDVNSKLQQDNLTDEERASLTARKEQLEKENDNYTEKGNWIQPTGVSGLEIDYENGTAKLNGKSFPLADGTEFLSDKSKLQSLMINGVLFVKNSTDDTNSFSPTSELLESNTDFEYVLDTSDDAAAESKHNYEISLLSAKENILEMDLAQLETQHEAVMKEYESVKELISNNVDRTFKLFSNG